MKEITDTSSSGHFVSEQNQAEVHVDELQMTEYVLPHVVNM